MTVIGWLQILLYCAIIVALVKPLGAYMTHVFNGERTWLSPVLRPVERAIYWAGGVDERREQSWLIYAIGMLLFHVGGFLILYALMRFQALLPFNPADMSAVRRGPVVQYRIELYHQHELAELRRREHPVVPGADARPHTPELSVRRHRHRAGRGSDSWLCQSLRPHGGQFLGRYHPLHALHPAADLHSLCPVPGLARHAADARALTSMQRRSRAPSRQLRWGQLPHRSRSRCSALMAAASSMPTRRIHSRTRPRSQISCR